MVAVPVMYIYLAASNAISLSKDSAIMAYCVLQYGNLWEILATQPGLCSSIQKEHKSAGDS